MEFLFVSFRSVSFLYVCWFRFRFSHKPKSMRPDGRPLFFFSRPRPNVSRLRRPGAARAQPWMYVMYRINYEMSYLKKIKHSSSVGVIFLYIYIRR